jgi:hypothetical protein
MSFWTFPNAWRYLTSLNETHRLWSVVKAFKKFVTMRCDKLDTFWVGSCQFIWQKIGQNRIIKMIENIMFSHAPRSIELVNETPEAVKRCQGLHIAWDDKNLPSGDTFWVGSSQFFGWSRSKPYHRNDRKYQVFTCTARYRTHKRDSRGYEALLRPSKACDDEMWQAGYFLGRF